MPNKAQTSVKNETLLKAPRKYAVIMHNDEITTMEFVVSVLIKVFHKAPTDAAKIMMQIHESERGLAGVYTYDIAVTKKIQADQLSGINGFPLKLTVEVIEE